MPAFEVLLRVRHDCPFIDLSERYPSLRIYSWCNRINEVMEVVVRDAEEYDAVLEEISKLSTLLEEAEAGLNAHLIVSTCFCTRDNSVAMNIEDIHILPLYPVVLERGWEYHRVVVFRHEDLSELVDRLQKRGFELDIMRKTLFTGTLANGLVSTDALFSHLTEKQMKALLIAYNKGYYKLPRASDVKEISRTERVPRTTFQEHLKKGENRIMEALIPYMYLYGAHERGPSRQGFTVM